MSSLEMLWKEAPFVYKVILLLSTILSSHIWSIIKTWKGGKSSREIDRIMSKTQFHLTKIRRIQEDLLKRQIAFLNIEVDSYILQLQSKFSEDLKDFTEKDSTTKELIYINYGHILKDSFSVIKEMLIKEFQGGDFYNKENGAYENHVKERMRKYGDLCLGEIEAKYRTRLMRVDFEIIKSRVHWERVEQLAFTIYNYAKYTWQRSQKVITEMEEQYRKELYQ